MAVMKFHTFDGIIPAIEPKNLPGTAAQVAQNVNFGSGRLDPWKEPLLVSAITAGKKSIYKWRRNSSSEWLKFTAVTDIIKSPVSDDQWDRIYYTDGVKPKVVGWDGGAKVTRDMEQPTAEAPTALAVPALLTDNSATDLLTLLKAATVTLTGTIYGWGQSANLGIIPSATGPAISTSADKTEIYLDYAYKCFTFTGTVGSAALYENNTVAAGTTSALTISMPIAGFGTLTQAASSTITNIGTLSFGSVTGASVLTNITQELYNWPINSASVGSGYRGILNGTWSNFYGNVVRVTLKIAYTDAALAAMNPSISKGQAKDHYYTYVQTLLNDWGMEGPPSPPSNEVGVMNGEKVRLSDFGDAQGATTRRFYRSAVGTKPEDTQFLFLADIPAGDSTYDDDQSDAELGGVIDLLENPPNGLKGIQSLPGGGAVAFKGRQVYFSIPNKPWSWPSDYTEMVDFDIIGLGVLGNDVYVLTDGFNYLISGYHPESRMVSRLATPQSCVSKRSIAVLGGMVVYASPDGLVGLRGGSGTLLTKRFYSRDDWQALAPSGMIGAVHDDRYYGFCSGGGVIFQFGEGSETCSTTDQTTTGIYEDPEDDTMYLIQGANINSWNRGAANLELTWQSKDFDSNRRHDWSSGRLVADSYPVTLKLYAEGSLVSTLTVADQKSFRIPKLVPERVWSVSVIASTPIDFFAVGESKQDLI